MFILLSMDFDSDIPSDDPVPARSRAREQDRAVDQTERHLAVLEKLRDMGMEVAAAMKSRAIDAEGKIDDKAAKALALVAKTVQQVMLLHQETAGLRKSLLAQRKVRAKQIMLRVIERERPSGNSRTLH